MIENEISIPVNGATLKGTLCRPGEGGPYPAVLMIHGSGPLDRNENMPGQRLDVFNTFARRLAASGFASLRYDKRGCGASTGDFLSAGHNDLIADAAECFDALAGADGTAAGEVFLLGHSEGCLIAPRVFRLRPAAAGLVLLCPLFETLEAALLRQAGQLEKELAARRGVAGRLGRFFAGIFGGPLAGQRTLIRKVKAASSPVLRVGFRRHPARWLKEIMAVDPREVFREIGAPMLLVGGEKDLQCRPDDIFRIAKTAGPGAEPALVDDLTHILRRDEDPPALADFPRLLKRPVDDRVLELVVEWLGRRSGRAEVGNEPGDILPITPGSG